MTPTAEQWDEITELMAEDCEIAGAYINAAGQTCAIGKLARTAGVSDTLLERSNVTSIQYVPELHYAIYERFGLTSYQQSRIQYANDGEYNERDCTVEERRARVLQHIADMRSE